MKLLIPLLFTVLTFGQSFEVEKPKDTLWYDNKPFLYQTHHINIVDGVPYLEKVYKYKRRIIYIRCRLEEVEPLKQMRA